MRIWVVKDDCGYGMCDAEKETAEYCPGARLMKLSDLNFSKEDFVEYERVRKEYVLWQEKINEAYDDFLIREYC
jgi:hypothetical protein